MTKIPLNFLISLLASLALLFASYFMTLANIDKNYFTPNASSKISVGYCAIWNGQSKYTIVDCVNVYAQYKISNVYKPLQADQNLCTGAGELPDIKDSTYNVHICLTSRSE